MARAAHAVAAVLFVTLAACGGDGAVETTITSTTNPPQPTTTEATTTTAAPTTTTAGRTALEQEALDLVARFIDAVNDGDVDTIETIIGDRSPVGGRRGWEFHATLNAAGTEWRQGDCEITESADWFVNLECPLTYAMPVFVAIGAHEAIAPYSLINGELRSPHWDALGLDFTFAQDAMVRYLEMVGDYAACDPAAQAGDYTESGGIARVPECAEVLVEHMNDMVAWIDAGEPDL